LINEKALRLTKMARAALIYLSLAIQWEERDRAKKRGPDVFIPGMPTDVWENDAKVYFSEKIIFFLT
jgi:hypothetical protein